MFRIITNTRYISSWQSKGLSDETIKPPATSDDCLNPQIDYRGKKVRVKYDGSILRQPKVSYTHRTVGFGQNVLIFGADTSSSVHIDNKKKDILVLGIGPTQGLEHTLTAEKMYSINFTVTKNKFCLRLHYNGENSYLFVNGREIIKFKAKDSVIVAIPLFLGNISKDWSSHNMKKTGLTGYVQNLFIC